MRILVSSPTFLPIVGGAELLIRDVADAWSERHEVRLVTPHLPASSAPFWTDDGSLESACRFQVRRFHDRLNLMDLPGHRRTRGVVPPMSLSALPELVVQLRSFRADVLVTFFGAPFGLPSVSAARFAGVPVALVFCGTDIPSPRTNVAPVWHSYLRRAASAADRAVYVSRFCFDALFPRGGFAPPHDVVIHGGIDLRSTRPTGDPVRLRHALGIGPEDVMLFSLQRLGPEKRVDVLVRAMAALPSLPRRVRLVIGGQGAEADALHRLAERLGVAGDVLFTGHLGPEKQDFYAAADVFVFHSLFETFGQVLVEAMAAGKPVVSVRVGAIPEVVSEGETGLLAPAEDERALAALIADLVRDEDRRRTMGAAARARVERMFDWDAVRRQWEALLDVGRLDEGRASRGEPVRAGDPSGAKGGW